MTSRSSLTLAVWEAQVGRHLTWDTPALFPLSLSRITKGEIHKTCTPRVSCAAWLYSMLLSAGASGIFIRFRRYLRIGSRDTNGDGQGNYFYWAKYFALISRRWRFVIKIHLHKIFYFCFFPSKAPTRSLNSYPTFVSNEICTSQPNNSFVLMLLNIIHTLHWI